MLFFSLFSRIRYPFFWYGLQMGAAYSSIGRTNHLKRQENARQLSFPSDRLITPNTLFALCLLCRRRVYPKIDGSLLWPLGPWQFQQILNTDLVAHLRVTWLRSVPTVRCTHDFTFFGIKAQLPLVTPNRLIYSGQAVRLRYPYQVHWSCDRFWCHQRRFWLLMLCLSKYHLYKW